MFVPAEGATVLTKMLYFAPSRAVVFVRPTIPHFCGRISRQTQSLMSMQGVTRIGDREQKGHGGEQGLTAAA
jgi:hypothetical protein